MEDLLEPTVSDHVPTGTPAILESPHVSDGPGKIANAPVPSVFVRSCFCGCRLFCDKPGNSHSLFTVFFQRDDRGSIDRLRVGGKRINLLSSKTGVMRSGYLHPEPKYGFVVCGEVEVWVLTNTGTKKKVRAA